MSEIQHSLQQMNVAQYLLAVAFLICYALVLGDFLGSGARLGLALGGLVCAAGFSALADHWVNGVVLCVFVLVGMGLFIGLAWTLKTLVLTWQKRHTPAPPTINVDPQRPAAFLPEGYYGTDEHAAVEHARG
jgi:hypothetical protein